MAKVNADAEINSVDDNSATGTMDPNSNPVKRGRKRGGGRARASESANSASSSTVLNPHNAKKGLKQDVSTGSPAEKAGQKQNNPRGHDLQATNPQPTKSQQNSNAVAPKGPSKANPKKVAKTTTPAALTRDTRGCQLVPGVPAENNVSRKEQHQPSGGQAQVVVTSTLESLGINPKQPPQVPSKLGSTNRETPKHSLPAEGASNEMGDKKNVPRWKKAKKLLAQEGSAPGTATQSNDVQNPRAQAAPKQVEQSNAVQNPRAQAAPKQVEGFGAFQLQSQVPVNAFQYPPLFDPAPLVPQAPRTPPPLDQPALEYIPALNSPQIIGALRPRPENNRTLIDGTGILVEDIHAFLRRFLRLQSMEGPNPIYPKGSAMHTETVDSITSLTMKWQSAEELHVDRYSLEHCTLRGKQVGKAIVTRAAATYYVGTLRGIMEFFDNYAKMATDEIARASKIPKEAGDFQEWGYASWIGCQYMDQRFFQEVRDTIIKYSRAERARIDKEKLLAEQADKQKIAANKAANAKAAGDKTMADAAAKAKAAEVEAAKIEATGKKVTDTEAAEKIFGMLGKISGREHSTNDSE